MAADLVNGYELTGIKLLHHNLIPGSFLNDLGDTEITRLVYVNKIGIAQLINVDLIAITRLHNINAVIPSFLLRDAMMQLAGLMTLKVVVIAVLGYSGNMIQSILR